MTESTERSSSRLRIPADHRLSVIFTRYFLICASFVMPACLLLNLIYSQHLSRSVDAEILRMNETSMERGASMLESTFQTMQELAFSIANMQEVQAASLAATQTSIIRTRYLDHAGEIMLFAERSHRYIDSIYLYMGTSDTIVASVASLSESTPGAAILHARHEFYDTTWYPYYSTTNRNISFCARSKADYWPRLLTVLAPIRHFTTSNSGAVVLNLNTRAFSQYLGTGVWQHDDEPIMLIFQKSDGQLIYSDEFRLLTQTDADFDFIRSAAMDGRYASFMTSLWNQMHVLSFKEILNGEMICCYLSPLSSYEAAAGRNNIFIISLVILSLLLTIVLSLLLAWHAYKPIKTLLNLAHQGPLAMAQLQQRDEIEAIKAYILKTQDTYERMSRQIDENAISLHNAQLNVLQSQIDPHFLYNTLEVIGDKMVLELGRENDCTDMLRILSRLLRLSLSSAAYLVPLSEEIEHVNMYMEIMSFRSEGRISWNVVIPNELLKRTVVKLSLQPIIENAILHGLRARRYEGAITLSAETDSAGFVLYVRDNGVGIAPETAQAINHRLATSNVQDFQHIGLDNVNQRIRLIFGRSSGVRVCPLECGGTEVSLRYNITPENDRFIHPPRY